MVPLTYKQICRQVQFPIYALPEDEATYIDGLLMVGGKVIDDRNQEGDTLGTRRRKSPHKLLRLTKAYFEFTDLLGCKDYYYIDNKGRTFYYKKTVLCDIKSIRIKQKISKDTHTLLQLEKVNSLFTINYYPFGSNWAQILMLGSLPWKLVGVSENELTTYKRKI